MRFLSFIFSVFLFSVFAKASDQLPDSVRNKIFSVTYMGDVAGCLKGGIKKGITYMGLLDLSADLKTSVMGLWKNGNLLVQLQNTHNDRTGSDLVGDLQVFDNIENGNYTYLYQLWYRQEIKNFWALAGIHDLNSEFLMSDYACEFVNSSFGIMPVSSMNHPVSIFPKTSFAILTGYNHEKFSVKAGIYEGDPGSLEEDPYNLKFKFDFNHGLLGIIETEFRHNILKNRPGYIKTGFSVHTGDHVHISDTSRYYHGNYNFYMIADQQLVAENDPSQGLGLMLQAGIAPDNRNVNDFYLALGLNYTGLFRNRDNDILGVALAHASISKPALSNNTLMKTGETVIEISWKSTFFNHLFIQPNIQYIINPGVSAGLKNALVIILRTGITI